jgi:hypothetical protein
MLVLPYPLEHALQKCQRVPQLAVPVKVAKLSCQRMHSGESWVNRESPIDSQSHLLFFLLGSFWLVLNYQDGLPDHINCWANIHGKWHHNGGMEIWEQDWFYLVSTIVRCQVQVNKWYKQRTKRVTYWLHRKLLMWSSDCTDPVYFNDCATCSWNIVVAQGANPLLLFHSM